MGLRNPDSQRALHVFQLERVNDRVALLWREPALHSAVVDVQTP